MHALSQPDALYLTSKNLVAHWFTGIDMGIWLQIKQIDCNTVTVRELETVKADFSVSSIMMGKRFSHVHIFSCGGLVSNHPKTWGLKSELFLFVSWLCISCWDEIRIFG